MIDIKKSQPRIIKIRYTCLKVFNIDVTIKNQTHNLGIVVKSEEDKQGQDTELIEIRIGTQVFVNIGEHEDVGEILNGYLGAWFDDHYPECPVEDSKEDFDNIFEAVWEYIEEKDLK